MPNLFGGLAQGIGAASQGYLLGQNRGEAEGYRRQQAADTLAARKEALHYQRQATDPDKDKRALYAHIGEGLVKVRSDPSMQAYFSDPANAGLTSEYDRVTAHAVGVATGRIPLDQADPNVLSFHPSLPGPSVPHPEGGAPGMSLGAPATPNTQPTLFALNQAAAGAELPPLTAPANLGEVRKRTFGTTALPFQPPTPAIPGVEPNPPQPPAPTEAAAAEPVGPAVPFDREVELNRLLQEGPPSKKMKIRPYETPADFLKEQAAADRQYTASVTRLTAAMGAIPRGRSAEAEAAQKVGELAGKSALRGAQTSAATEAAATSRALRPLTAEQKREAARKAKAEREAIPVNLGLQGRTVGAAERNAATNAGRLAEEKRYHDQLAEKARASLKRAATSKEDADDVSLISQGLRATTAAKRGIAGNDVFTLPAAERAKWQKRIDAALARREARRAGGGSASVSESVSVSGPSPAAASRTTPTGRVIPIKPAAPPTAPKGQNPITKGEIDHIQAAMNVGAGPFNDWLNKLSPTLRARAKLVRDHILKR